MLLPRFSKKLFFLFLIFLLPEIVFSQTRTKATVSPFIIEEKVFPGQKFFREITFTNESDEKLKFSVLIRDIRLDEKGNLFLLPPKTERFSLADWIEVLEKEIEILPGESKKIKVFFKIPEKEAVGSRQGAIIFASESNLPEQQREGVFATFSHQIGVLIFLSSVEGVKEEAKILTFKTEKDLYFTPFLVKFQIEIENLGNVYLEPQGKIEIDDFFGKKVKEIIFNSQRFKILPEGKRIFEETWQGKFGFGKYTANFYLVFGSPETQGGSGVKTISATTFFWILPLREIIVGFLILVLFFWLLFALIKRYKRISKKLKNAN